MRARPSWALALAAITLVVAGCTPGNGVPPAAPTLGASTSSAVAEPTGTPEPSAWSTPPPAATPGPTVALGSAPVDSFAVGRRQLDLVRGNRPLRTVVWYPVTTAIGSGQSIVAPGVFPLVLFSHGLTSSPEAYQLLAQRIASAGFVVAAPAYPFTNAAASPYNPADLVNQPADASAVITAMLALGATAGDPLDGHLDVSRVAAAGHSGGGYTTVGLLAGARDARVSAAIVIAGGSLGGAFTNPPASVLFVHGDNDPVVTYSVGRATYQQVPWSKAFLTVVGGDHGSYLYTSTSAAAAVAATTVDFLRFCLYGDLAAGARLPTDALVNGRTTFESTL